MKNQQFEKHSLISITILHLFTSGLYGVYWLVKNGKLTDKTEGRKFPMSRMLATLTVTLIALVGFSIGYAGMHKESGSASNVMSMLFVVVMLIALSIYLVAAKLSARIARAINLDNSSNVKCSPRTAFVLTLVGFVSVLYLQYYINKIIEVQVDRVRLD